MHKPVGRMLLLEVQPHGLTHNQSFYFYPQRIHNSLEDKRHCEISRWITDRKQKGVQQGTGHMLSPFKSKSTKIQVHPKLCSGVLFFSPLLNNRKLLIVFRVQQQARALFWLQASDHSRGPKCSQALTRPSCQHEHKRKAYKPILRSHFTNVLWQEPCF